MRWEARLAQAFGLDNAGWDRHANPWSGWSRMITGWPVIIAVGWSRLWIGWWAVPLALVAALWLWRNPLSFPPARDDRSWMSRAVWGERLWIRREGLADAGLAVWKFHGWNVLAGLGAVVAIYGIVMFDVIACFSGALASFFAKIGFIARCEKLYRRAVAAHPEWRRGQIAGGELP
ncbi:DUF6653 family protein [Croceicoccus sp. Ery15]|uniref:DUF6653 family protein n=1 Tax=Croceicoccus sp. Ery15 TaxID=1703338 RepID=UPI001E46BA74|nr:DUF6653 family protein [Croceicoccus sp. Ery15]